MFLISTRRRLRWRFIGEELCPNSKIPDTESPPLAKGGQGGFAFEVPQKCYLYTFQSRSRNPDLLTMRRFTAVTKSSAVPMISTDFFALVMPV
jgi:hypothetical protein